MLIDIFVNGSETSTTSCPSDSINLATLWTSCCASSEIPSPINSFIIPIFAFLSFGCCAFDSVNEVASSGSCPFIELNINLASATLLVIGPIWSNDEANATSPYLETVPYVGLNPTTPQKDAGCLIEPPVSLPNEATAEPADTTAAEPPEDPPGTLEESHGFLVGP